MKPFSRSQVSAGLSKVIPWNPFVNDEPILRKLVNNRIVKSIQLTYWQHDRSPPGRRAGIERAEMSAQTGRRPCIGRIHRIETNHGHGLDCGQSVPGTSNVYLFQLEGHLQKDVELVASFIISLLIILQSISTSQLVSNIFQQRIAAF